MEKWAQGNRFTRILPGDGREAALVLDIDLAGGVTEEHIAAMIRRFDEQVRSFGA